MDEDEWEDMTAPTYIAYYVQIEGGTDSAEDPEYWTVRCCDMKEEALTVRDQLRQLCDSCVDIRITCEVLPK